MSLYLTMTLYQDPLYLGHYCHYDIFKIPKQWNIKNAILILQDYNFDKAFYIYQLIRL